MYHIVKVVQQREERTRGREREGKGREGKGREGKGRKEVMARYAPR